MILPNYDFKCTKGHVFELNIPSSETKKKRKCIKPNCNCFAKKTFLPKLESKIASNPSLFLVNDKTGHVFNPGRNDLTHLPPDFVKKLLSEGYKEFHIDSQRSYEKFQKEIYPKQKELIDKHMEFEQNAYDAALRENLKAMNEGGTIEIQDLKGNWKTVKIPPLREMSEQGKRFALHAIKQAEKVKFRNKGTMPILPIREYDGKMPNTDVDVYGFRDENDRNRKKWF